MATEAEAPGRPHFDGEDGRCAAITWTADEAVRLWEALFDEDAELAGILFWDALLMDARAEYDRKPNHDVDDDQHLTRAFEPWHPQAPSVSVPPPPVVPPTVKQTVVLALSAPSRLARKHDRAPQGPAGGRHPQGMKKPRIL